ncbi:MAG: 4-phosphoerythronate dehydrogenase [Bacteroidales bacterium]|nr:4-phosphoerythronate dehydrogenase [Bacteroidales bacterium]
MNNGAVKIVIDADIPFIKGVFEKCADVLYLQGSDIAQYLDSLSDREAAQEHILIIRTRTKCNAATLSGVNVKMIATATIGTDHIDLEYCKSRGIKVASAQGCNSAAVMQYVYTSLAALSKIPADRGARGEKVIGVIGAGNVGEKVACLATALGFKVMRNDPPKELEQLADGFKGERLPYYSLEQTLSCSDIVTLHIPLNESTANMADASFFAKMKSGTIFINSSRGEVVDETALLAAQGVSDVIIDVWRGEPHINLALLERASLATPHIAGYSVEGKENGTTAVVRAVASYLGIEQFVSFKASAADCRHLLNIEGDIPSQLLSFFPIMELDKQLRATPQDFETIRTQYTLRNEFKY